MEGICSSETSVDFQRTTQRYTTGESTMSNHPFTPIVLCSIQFMWVLFNSVKLFTSSVFKERSLFCSSQYKNKPYLLPIYGGTKLMQAVSRARNLR
jgi:hypothetical protein